jgi:hypothetical protein
MKYAVEMGSGVMIYKRSFLVIGWAIDGGEDMKTHKQTFNFLKIREVG